MVLKKGENNNVRKDAAVSATMADRMSKGREERRRKIKTKQSNT